MGQTQARYIFERNESDSENLLIRIRDKTVNAVGERVGIEGYWNTVPAGDIEFELIDVSSGRAAIVFSPHSGSGTKNEAMRITSDGYVRVGINESSPCDLLHLGGYGRLFSDTQGYNFDGNIFNSYSWSPMSDLSSPPAGFTINGGADENSIVYGQTPLGSDDYYYATGLLWRFQDSGNSSASGGFLTATPYPKIDRDKTYRMSVWIKRSHQSEGAYYMGLYGMDGATGSNVGLQDVSRRCVANGAISAGDTSITIDGNVSMLDGGGSTVRYAVINNTDKFSYTDVNGNTLTGIPETGTWSISQNHADNVKIMQLETNAYFVSGDLPEVDKWYLAVGYVQGRNDTDYTDRGAVYDGETGNRVAGCGNFMWYDESTYVKNRVYMFYSDDDPEQIQHAFGPRFEEISNAPHINSLLGGKITTGMSIKNDTSDTTPTSGYVTLGEHGGALEINTASGYLRLGATSTSWNHMLGENSKFYFNKPLVIDGGDATGDNFLLSSYNQEDMVLATNNGTSVKMTLKHDTGNVGIGAIAPQAKLHITTSEGSQEGLRVYRNDSSTQEPLVLIWEDSPYADQPALKVRQDNVDQSPYPPAIHAEGAITSSLGYLNTTQMYNWNRADMNSNAMNLKAITNEHNSSQNHWQYFMPKNGTIKKIVLEILDGAPGTGQSTWRISRNNASSGTINGTAATFIFYSQRTTSGTYQNDTGVSGAAKLQLTVASFSSTAYKGETNINFPFLAGEAIRIQRTGTGGADYHNCSAQLYVEFD